MVVIDSSQLLNRHSSPQSLATNVQEVNRITNNVKDVCKNQLIVLKNPDCLNALLDQIHTLAQINEPLQEVGFAPKMHQMFQNLVVKAWSISKYSAPEKFVTKMIAQDYQRRVKDILANWEDLGMLSDGHTVYLSAARSQMMVSRALEPLNVKWVKVEGVPIPLSLKVLSEMDVDLEDITTFVKIQLNDENIVEIPKTFQGLFGPRFDDQKQLWTLDLDWEVFSVVARYIYQGKVYNKALIPEANQFLNTRGLEPIPEAAK
ncbi:MAG: hypothetical protein Q8K75_00875 [Chlamydiales bacterium]|nr:hypothetical protein [Chlamydiales bacterium]